MLLFSIMSRKLRGIWASLKARRRGTRAAQGEARAEALLLRRGYAIAGRQVRATTTLLVNGSPVEFEVRADLIVERRGARFVAEVKTGSFAPRLTNVATRRQLLEYALVFRSPAVLLVDVERKEITEVQFFADGAAPLSLLTEDVS